MVRERVDSGARSGRGKIVVRDRVDSGASGGRSGERVGEWEAD